jgi:HEAT repeat protein
MSDGKQLKTVGLRFARGLHMTIKTAVIFTVDHKSVERPIQQSFQFLNSLLKEAGQFTFGFVDNQVMLNNLLTTDTTLRQLETEFLKRGIAAVTFEPGLTLARYKRVISLLSAPTKIIEEAGGILVFLDQNEIEGARILPAARNQKKDEHGDTIIETDSESYILSKQMTEDDTPRDLLDSIDALLQSACYDPSTRAEVFSNFAAHGMDGAGFGVPVSTNVVLLKEGETVQPAGSATGAPPAQATNGSGGYGAAAAMAPAPNPAQHFTASGPHPLPNIEGIRQAPGTGDAGIPSNLPSLPRNFASAGNSNSFIELVEASVQRSLLEEKGSPEKSYTSLARILRNMGVDKILAQFPAERREELVTLSPERLAAEYIEDTALQLAGERLKSADGHSHKMMIEEEVVRVLARSLQATHMADRLAQKLSKFIQDFAVPPHIQERIREELRWTSLNPQKKYAALMEREHYSSVEFRRLIELVRELAAQREIDRASALAGHYFDFLDKENAEIDIAELSRAPELIRSIPLAQVTVAAKTADRLGRTLMRNDLPELVHFQVVNALTILGQSISAFEDFSNVLAIGVSLEQSNNRAPEKHKKCCGTGLSRLLSPAAIERIIELFLVQRNDSAWSRMAATLLRFGAPASVESVFAHLIKEEDAKNRLAMVRLVGLLGKGSTEVAYKYLDDERWYVVRNICGVLAELKDPDLADHIAPALQHEDPRVQQAALKALINSRTVRAAPVLAAALPKLAPKVLDEALDELMFLRHVKTISGLEEFVCGGSSSPAATRKVIQVLSCIDDDEALNALERIFSAQELDGRMRRAALSVLYKHPSPHATKLLEDLAALGGPFTDEIHSELRARGRR